MVHKRIKIQMERELTFYIKYFVSLSDFCFNSLKNVSLFLTKMKAEKKHLTGLSLSIIAL